MDSKEIIVELIVIGFGFMVFTILMGLHINKQAIELLLDLPSALSLFFISITCYVSGVIIDRMADRLFSFPEDYVRKNSMTNDVDFKDARSEVFSISPHVKEWIEYGRIRIRVVRGWSLNLIAIILLIVWDHLSDGPNTIFGDHHLIISLLTLIIFVGCVYSWFSLTRGECRRIDNEYSRTR